MLKEIIEINNVFDNPDEIVEIAKRYKYYSIDNHPVDKNTNISWEGFRTEFILGDNLQFMQNQITRKLFSSVRSNVNINVQQDMRMEFHYLTENEKHRKDLFHIDTTIMAGVVYLSKEINNNPDCGTILLLDDKETIVNNSYNKLIMYRGDYTHAPANGFGSNINDARLTLNFFIHSIDISIK